MESLNEGESRGRGRENRKREESGKERERRCMKSSVQSITRQPNCVQDEIK